MTIRCGDCGVVALSTKDERLPAGDRLKLRPLPWYGGKSGYGKAKWIAGLLP